MHFTSFWRKDGRRWRSPGEIGHHCAKAYIQAIAAKIEAYTPSLRAGFFRRFPLWILPHCRGHQHSKSMTQIEGGCF